LDTLEKANELQRPERFRQRLDRVEAQQDAARSGSAAQASTSIRIRIRIRTHSIMTVSLHVTLKVSKDN
jgi:hypothetical protein